MTNHLQGQTSPYLLQHAENPVDWYPWAPEAFAKAAAEDKPVFLSIGYSTCHWCHVMAHESFEDRELAALLNRYFIAVKVDKEERPDLDSIYMVVCQAFTGSGGWPTTIFLTPEQRPFFAGTYFPKTARSGMPGLTELLLAIHDKWEHNRAGLLRTADRMVLALSEEQTSQSQDGDALLTAALKQYEQSFDPSYGGFGSAPKFPAPHNLLFLLEQYRKHGQRKLLEMAEKTLMQMYRGGLFDAIGGGFCRYSTDRFYLVPHFEKMLYDNALLITAYCRLYELTGTDLYRQVAKQTAAYIQREMTSPQGGFYSAQDADSDGEEGKYYVFTPGEIKSVLGEAEGAAFCAHYNITENGNFQGKSIPNLLPAGLPTERFDSLMPQLLAYRKGRTSLHTDDKILTFWNGLMIAAFCALYRITEDKTYLAAAEAAQQFIENNLWDGDTLFVSWRKGKRGGPGFLDDYAGYIHALLCLYEATYENAYLRRAQYLTEKVTEEYFDTENGGFYLSGKRNEALIARTKVTYDGAIPSGNTWMAWNLFRLSRFVPAVSTDALLEQQLRFLSGTASAYPAGYALFLTTLSDFLEPPPQVTVIQAQTPLPQLPFRVPSDMLVRLLYAPADGYQLLNGKAAFYVCQAHACLPPQNEAEFYASLNSSLPH